MVFPCFFFPELLAFWSLLAFFFHQFSGSSRDDQFSGKKKHKDCLDPPTLAFFGKKARETRKKNKGKNLGKGRKTHKKKKQGKSENNKSKDIEKSKDWRVRIRRPPGGVGSSTRKGWSCPPSKVCLPWVSKGGIWDVPGILPGCPGPLKGVQKVCAKKLVLNFRPLTSCYFHFAEKQQGKKNRVLTLQESLQQKLVTYLTNFNGISFWVLVRAPGRFPNESVFQMM